MKITKISLFSLAGAILVGAIVVMAMFTFAGKPIGGEVGEVAGWALAISMGVLMTIFVMRLIFKNPKTKPETKQKLQKVYLWMNQLHMSVGAVSLALMYLHFALVFDPANAGWVHFITGYILIGLMAFLAAFGFSAHFNKTPARKYLTLCHQIDVALLVVTFIIHLILK